MNTDDAESTSLNLLQDVQAELRDALNALGGIEAQGLLQHYPFYTASTINRAVEGYIFLRTSGRFEASKLLVRTALEAVIRIRALQRQPELMFRIAFTEYLEDRKWVRSIKHPDADSALQAIDDGWQDFRKAYSAKYPGHGLVEKEINLREVAKIAGIEGYYNSHYRLYCRFTHAALQASIGDLGNFESEDNRTMILCTLAAIEGLTSIGAPASNISALKKRFSSL